jgi:hypothetical protein
MNDINQVLQKEDPSLEELLHCFETIKDNGDLGMIKFDGMRKDNHYTVWVGFPMETGKESFRLDGSDLKKTIMKVLARYLESYERH